MPWWAFEGKTRCGIGQYLKGCIPGFLRLHRRKCTTAQQIGAVVAVICIVVPETVLIGYRLILKVTMTASMRRHKRWGVMPDSNRRIV